MSKEEGGRKKEKERASEGGNIGEKRRDGNYFLGMLSIEKKKLKSSEIGIDKSTKNMVNQNQPPKIVISSLRAK